MEVEAHHNHEVHHEVHHEAQVHEAQDHEAHHEKVHHGHQDVHPAMPSALAMRFPHPCRWPLQPHQPVGLPWQTLCPVFAHGVRRVHEEVDGYVVPVHVVPAHVVPVHAIFLREQNPNGLAPIPISGC